MVTYVRERPKLQPDELPSEREIDGFRRDLVSKLRVIQSQHRRSPTIAALRERLTAELGPGVAAEWTEGATEGAFRKRRERAAAITGQLDDFDSSLHKVAGRLEHGMWLSWRL